MNYFRTNCSDHNLVTWFIYQFSNTFDGVNLIPILFSSIRYQRRQHLIDVTEIFNLLNWEKKQRLFKLGYLIFLLFLSIFWYSDQRKAAAYMYLLLSFLRPLEWDCLTFFVCIVGWFWAHWRIMIMISLARMVVLRDIISVITQYHYGCLLSDDCIQLLPCFYTKVVVTDMLWEKFQGLEVGFLVFLW